MREKIWKHCPACGAKDSMKLKENQSQTFKGQTGKSIKVDGLSLYVCTKCGDSIATKSSDKKINASITELRARELSETIVAAEISSVDEVVKAAGITRQAVHQMMNDGRIQYVFIGELRFPLKQEVKRIKLVKKKEQSKKKTASG